MAGIAVLVAVLAAVAVTQQRKPRLHIDSPREGTVVRPGQTMAVLVSSSRGVDYKEITLHGEGPLGMSEIDQPVPTQFLVTIPSRLAACRRYKLTAEGVTTMGQSVDSNSIDLDIERPDTPVSISSFQFPSLILDRKDPPFHLIILAAFADESQIVVTESSYVAYQSSDTAVVTVNQYGGVRAVGPGTASVHVVYKNSSEGTAITSVPVTVLSSGEN